MLFRSANNLISGSLSALPLMGNELLAIDISIPTMVSKEKNNDNISDADEYYFNNYNIVGIFRITSIKRNLEREKLQSYNIQFASEEFVLNENLNISNDAKEFILNISNGSAKILINFLEKIKFALKVALEPIILM